MNKTTTCGLVTAVSGISTILQPNDQLQVIQFWLTIGLSVLTALTFLYDLISGMVSIYKKWHAKAMEDGKITHAERKQLKRLMKEEFKARMKALMAKIDENTEEAEIEPKTEEVKSINEVNNNKGHGGTF